MDKQLSNVGLRKEAQSTQIEPGRRFEREPSMAITQGRGRMAPLVAARVMAGRITWEKASRNEEALYIAFPVVSCL
ncbi:hypothetical protein HYPDE_32448 [Hyphomicrobium denitrificans 1NES1]|uniref:Uncharacterized protein n=1 Tax=Hyphomicrobium denitrificans 1NES1 TaxID=670307 RepID=N0B7C5_9HYPH|nr:hypothetical protein HYPDE_32448 [Hyphomicrobium denitrificans 1NES1]